MMTFLRWVILALVLFFICSLVAANRHSSDKDASLVPAKVQEVQNQTAKASSKNAQPMNKTEINNLAKKMAVATYYQLGLERMYGRAFVTVDESNEDILKVSMVYIPVERRDSILDSGLYEKAKDAKIKKIRFIDGSQNESYVDIK